MKKKWTPVFVIAGIVLLLFGGVVGIQLVQRYMPSKNQADIGELLGITDDVSQAAIYLNGCLLYTSRVTDRVMREVEYLMRVSDEKEEERYRQLDAAIRSTQKSGKSHAEAAATKLPFFRKKRFGKSGKKLF